MIYSCGCSNGVLNIDPEIYIMMSVSQLENRCLSEQVSDYGNPFINSVLELGEVKKKEYNKGTILDEEPDYEDEQNEDDAITLDIDYFNGDDYKGDD